MQQYIRNISFANSVMGHTPNRFPRLLLRTKPSLILYGLCEDLVKMQGWRPQPYEGGCLRIANLESPLMIFITLHNGQLTSYNNFFYPHDRTI